MALLILCLTLRAETGTHGVTHPTAPPLLPLPRSPSLPRGEIVLPDLLQSGVAFAYKTQTEVTLGKRFNRCLTSPSPLLVSLKVAASFETVGQQF